MIDLHCHVLPNMDDGPSGLDESLRMCRMAADDGIKTIVATPHTLNGVYANDRAAILNAVSALNNSIKASGIDITVVPGSDVHMDASLIEEFDRGSVMTINDIRRALLIEPPNFPRLEIIKQQVFELRLRGVVPVLTHPERNAVLMQNMDWLIELIGAGMLVQITAMSVTGGFGSDIKERAIELLNRGMAHVIASDAHNSTYRKPVLSDAVSAASGIIGKEAALKTVFDTPLALIEGRMPDTTKAPVDGLKSTKRSFLSLFKGSRD